MFSYKEILDLVERQVSQEFNGVTDWVHNIGHVKKVVSYAEKILAKEEDGLAAKMKIEPAKFAFLAQMACWLHDLGRTLEAKPSLWGAEFNHALESEKIAEKILPDYWFKNPGLTNKDKILVLQAIKEHNQPTPEHKNNLITRVLQDADRGEGFGYEGMIHVLQSIKVINLKKRPDNSSDYQKTFLKKVWPVLLSDAKKRKQAIHWFTFLKQWYVGGWALSRKKLGEFGRARVCPLYTETAKQIYKKRFLIIKKYLQKLKEIEK